MTEPALDLAWREASLSARGENVLLLRLDHTLRAVGDRTMQEGRIVAAPSARADDAREHR